MFCRIVVALVEDIAERSARNNVCEAFIQGPEKSFDLSLKPRLLARCILRNYGYGQAKLLQALAVKLHAVVKRDSAGQTVCRPFRPNLWIFVSEVQLR